MADASSFFLSRHRNITAIVEGYLCVSQLLGLIKHLTISLCVSFEGNLDSAYEINNMTS